MVIPSVNIVGKLTLGLDYFFKMWSTFIRAQLDLPLQNSAPHKYQYISGLLFDFQIFRSEGKGKGRTAVSKNKDMFERAGRA